MEIAEIIDLIINEGVRVVTEDATPARALRTWVTVKERDSEMVLRR